MKARHVNLADILEAQSQREVDLSAPTLDIKPPVVWTREELDHETNKRRWHRYLKETNAAMKRNREKVA